MARSEPNTLVLNVTLVGSNPLVWRELLVPANVLVHHLHRIIQAAMGWQDLHLHEFTIGERSYGPEDDDAPEDQLDETQHTLEGILQGADSFEYKYDFGDSWLHQITVKERTVAERSLKFAVAVAGENACPRENSGGVARHSIIVEILGKPDHELHVEMRKEFGPYDPTSFDLASTNARLQRL
jgi:hypothetical protein